MYNPVLFWSFSQVESFRSVCLSVLIKILNLILMLEIPSNDLVSNWNLKYKHFFLLLILWQTEYGSVHLWNSNCQSVGVLSIKSAPKSATGSWMDHQCPRGPIHQTSKKVKVLNVSWCSEFQSLFYRILSYLSHTISQLSRLGTSIEGALNCATTCPLTRFSDAKPHLTPFNFI